MNELVVAAFLHADVKKAEELELDDNLEFAFFRNHNYKVHMCVKTASSMMRLAVNVFDTGAGPIVIHTSSLPVK